MPTTGEKQGRSAETAVSSEGPIVVGFDGSDGGRDALALARALDPAGSRRYVVAVAETYGPVGVHRAISDEEDAEEAPLFAEAREILGDERVETRMVGTRSPGRMLQECAEREDAGTLVVGSPHRGRIGRALLGSVAEHVLHRSPCEVVVAPRGYASRYHPELKKIAVAYDGTPESRAALRRAEAIARGAGATIEILVAEDPLVSSIEAESPRRPASTQASASAVLSEALGAVDPDLSPTGKCLDPGWQQVDSSIAAAIAAACDGDVDLLVAGTRRPLERALMGSVTNHLIGDAPCPVLVVPHAE